MLLDATPCYTVRFPQGHADVLRHSWRGHWALHFNTFHAFWLITYNLWLIIFWLFSILFNWLYLFVLIFESPWSIEDEERYETDVPEEADWRTRAQQFGARVSLNKSQLKTWAKICDSMRYHTISIDIPWKALQQWDFLAEGKVQNLVLRNVQLAFWARAFTISFGLHVQGWIYWTRKLPSWKRSKLRLFSNLCSIGCVPTQRPARQKEEEEKGVSGEVVTITTKLPDVHSNKM